MSRRFVFWKHKRVKIISGIKNIITESKFLQLFWKFNTYFSILKEIKHTLEIFIYSHDFVFFFIISLANGVIKLV